MLLHCHWAQPDLRLEPNTQHSLCHIAHPKRTRSLDNESTEDIDMDGDNTLRKILGIKPDSPG